MILELPPLAIPGHEPSSTAGSTHPMRTVTRQAAGFEPGGWTRAIRDDVAELFDGLADEWVMRLTPERAQVVADALERGGPLGAMALELGAGNGAYTPMIAERVDHVVAIELSREMLLRQQPEPGRGVRADAAVLPIRDGSADSLILINMLLFPDEVDRVLAPRGVVLWVNSSGEHTPIHLLPEEVADALPGSWEGVKARAGVGIWCALRRAS